MTTDKAMDMLANASRYLDSTSFVSDSYHDASRILRTAYGLVGSKAVLKVHVQSNGRVVTEVWTSLSKLADVL